MIAELNLPQDVLPFAFERLRELTYRFHGWLDPVILDLLKGAATNTSSGRAYFLAPAPRHSQLVNSLAKFALVHPLSITAGVVADSDRRTCFSLNGRCWHVNLFSVNMYYVIINGQVEGPLPMSQLQALEGAGRITIATQISDAQTPEDWMLWRDLRPHTPNPSSYRTSTQASSPSFYDSKQALGSLREETAYGNLRLTFQVFAIIDLICATIFIGAMFFDPDRAALYIIAAAVSVVSIVPLAMSNVLIDIEDLLLKKQEDD